MDFSIRKGNLTCDFTGNPQAVMVKVIHESSLDPSLKIETPFLSREVLQEALRLLDAAENRQPQMFASGFTTTNTTPYTAPYPQPETPAPIPTPSVDPQPKAPQPLQKKLPGGMTPEELESAKEFRSGLVDMIDNPPTGPNGQPIDGVRELDLRDLFLSHSASFRDPVRSLYPIIRGHVTGFTEERIKAWLA